MSILAVQSNKIAKGGLELLSWVCFKITWENRILIKTEKKDDKCFFILSYYLSSGNTCALLHVCFRMQRFTCNYQPLQKYETSSMSLNPCEVNFHATHQTLQMEFSSTSQYTPSSIQQRDEHKCTVHILFPLGIKKRFTTIQHLIQEMQ